ncbi:MAG: ABC transporter ATP-binding protein [Chloroflexota bacterium]
MKAFVDSTQAGQRRDEASPSPSLLEVRDLCVELAAIAGAQALRGVTLGVAKGEVVGLVGESGCGKTTTALVILRLLSSQFRVVSGVISFAGLDLLTMSEHDMRDLRGGRIAMIFQDPLRHLNPVFTVADQLSMVVRTHVRGLTSREVRARGLELLAQVRISDPERCMRSYPHQLSGGMAQRVMIAMALSGSPELLLADEPTAALDVTVQAEVLRLLRAIARERQMAMLFISHNLGAVWQLCDRVYVMYAGQVVEAASSTTLFSQPEHPYSRALLDAVPHLQVEQTLLASIPGAAPSVTDMPAGCAFHPRCAYAQDKCRATVPPPVSLGAPAERREARCLFAGALPD